MAKESGITTQYTIDDSSGSGRDISNDISDYAFATPRGVHEVTGLDKSAVERLLLLADFTITLNGLFNDAANLSHAVFKTISSTSVARTCALSLSGQTLNNETFFTDYALTRSPAGELVWTTPGALTGGTVPTWS